MPAECGSRSRSSGRSRASTRAPRRIVTRTHARLTRSVTFPRLATRSSSRLRRACTRRTANRRTTFPGARTTTTTPSRIRTASPAPASGRVVSSTSSRVVAGLGAGAGLEPTISTDALAPGARVSRAGRTLSHETRRASDPWPAAEVEREAAPDDVDDGRPASRVRHTDHPRARAADCEMRRRGDQRHGWPAARPRGGGAGGQERDRCERRSSPADQRVGDGRRVVARSDGGQRPREADRRRPGVSADGRCAPMSCRSPGRLRERSGSQPGRRRRATRRAFRRPERCSPGRAAGRPA